MNFGRGEGEEGGGRGEMGREVIVSSNRTVNVHLHK